MYSMYNRKNPEAQRLLSMKSSALAALEVDHAPTGGSDEGLEDSVWYSTLGHRSPGREGRSKFGTHSRRIRSQAKQEPPEAAARRKFGHE